MKQRTVWMLALLVVLVPAFSAVLWWYLIPGITVIVYGMDHELVTFRQLELLLVPIVGYIMMAVLVVLVVNAARKLKCPHNCGLLWTFVQVFVITLVGSVAFTLMAGITSAVTVPALETSRYLTATELAELFYRATYVPVLVQIITAMFTLGFVIAIAMGLAGEFKGLRPDRRQVRAQ